MPGRPASLPPQALAKLREPRALVRCRQVDVQLVQDAMGAAQVGGAFCSLEAGPADVACTMCRHARCSVAQCWAAACARPATCVLRPDASFKFAVRACAPAV